VKELATGTEEENEEIDNMLNEFETEVNNQKMMDINMMPVNQQPGITVPK